MVACASPEPRIVNADGTSLVMANMGPSLQVQRAQKVTSYLARFSRYGLDTPKLAKLCAHLSKSRANARAHAQRGIKAS